MNHEVHTTKEKSELRGTGGKGNEFTRGNRDSDNTATRPLTAHKVHREPGGANKAVVFEATKDRQPTKKVVEMREVPKPKTSSPKPSSFTLSRSNTISTIDKVRDVVRLPNIGRKLRQELRKNKADIPPGARRHIRFVKATRNQTGHIVPEVPVLPRGLKKAAEKALDILVKKGKATYR